MNRELQRLAAFVHRLGLPEKPLPLRRVRLFFDKGLDRRSRIGYIMEDAGGVNALELTPEERLKRITPKLQKELINLNVLDYLCGMVDHSPGNYNVLLDEKGMFSGVRCFDNNRSVSYMC